MLNTLKEQLRQSKSWQERLRLLILASKNLPILSPSQLKEMEEIHGCEAKLWWKSSTKNRRIDCQAYSEARIMNGLLWLILEETKHQDVETLRQFSLDDFLQSLGILQNLSQSRLFGLKEIEKRLQQTLCC